MAATYTVGDGKTYATIQAAIDAIPGNLSGQGVQTVEVYAKAAGYAETLDISIGFINGSATGYIDIVAMVSHDGLRGGGIVLDVSSAIQNQIEIGAAYTRFHGFCVKGNLTWNSAYLRVFHATALVCRIYDNIGYDLVANQAAQRARFYEVDTGGGCLLYNNQVFDVQNSSKHDWAFAIINVNGTSGNPHVIANNAYYSREMSGQGAAGNNWQYIYCINNYIATDRGNYDYFQFSGANNIIQYNISADATADDWGTNNLTNKAAANQFVSVTLDAEDFRLKNGSDCMRAQSGFDCRAYFTTDCRGVARTRWDTGAFEGQITDRRGGDDIMVINGVET